MLYLTTKNYVVLVLLEWTIGSSLEILVFVVFVVVAASDRITVFYRIIRITAIRILNIPLVAKTVAVPGELLTFLSFSFCGNRTLANILAGQDTR